MSDKSCINLFQVQCQELYQWNSVLQLSTEGNHSISGDESMQVYDTYYHTYRLKDLKINSNGSVHKSPLGGDPKCRIKIRGFYHCYF